MIVDDSAVVRGLIARAVDGHPLMQVAASAANGEIAVKTLEVTPVDVIILDIEMPVMDGLTALPKLLAIDPAVKVIVASTLSLKNAAISMKALELGATDYMPKPSSTRELTTARDFKDELIEKVLALAIAARKAGVRRADPATLPPKPQVAVSAPAPIAKVASLPVRPPPEARGKINLRPMPLQRPHIVAIGSSTGGPQALMRVIKDIGTISQPVIITQHMPPNFTTIMAQSIAKECGVTCVEAQDGMACEAGIYYVAPGDYHMLVQNRSGKTILTINRDPPENFCRPAVDPMLRSAVAVYGQRILVVILTGMGQDGCLGGTKVVEAGGAVIAQDEATSVVWGMPGAAAHAGICSAVLPVGDIGRCVRKIVGAT
ncbi:MAG: chemotaxis response regulator protein-glutamate methylesterase [Alphaproteobacteria bacterium]